MPTPATNVTTGSATPAMQVDGADALSDRRGTGWPWQRASGAPARDAEAPQPAGRARRRSARRGPRSRPGPGHDRRVSELRGRPARPRWAARSRVSCPRSSYASRGAPRGRVPIEARVMAAGRHGRCQLVPAHRAAAATSAGAPWQAGSMRDTRSRARGAIGSGHSRVSSDDADYQASATRSEHGRYRKRGWWPAPSRRR